METSNPKNINAFHIAPHQEWWQGRISAVNSPQYFYQGVRNWNPSTTIAVQALAQNAKYALIGYACDEGVRRNHGRIGAIEGPVAIREQLAKLAFPFPDFSLIDLGNILCQQGLMELAQELLAEQVHNILEAGLFPIVLGGGHDMAYGHFLGIFKALETKGQVNLGIINLDAHFDLRPLNKQGNSGTPFFQIHQYLANKQVPFQYFVVGIQEQANTPELFDQATQLGITYIPSKQCHFSRLAEIKMQLQPFIDQVDQIYLSVDLDAFTSAYAPGVSAPSPIGFAPHFAIELLDFIMDSGKVISCDIAELNPQFDQDETTARLAADLLHTILQKTPKAS